MTDQQNRLADKNAGASQPPAADGTPKTGATSRQAAQSFWRVLIVSVLVVLGFVVGFQIGEAIVNYASTQGDDSGRFINALRLIVINRNAAFIDEALLGLIGALAAFLVGSSAFTKVYILAENVHHMKANDKIALFTGLLAGLILTVILSEFLTQIPHIGWLLTVFIGVILIYIGISGTLSMKDSFRITRANPSSGDFEPTPAGEPTSSQLKILDTNVIIDGRVSDVCRTGFIEGTIYIPGFVLDELQHIADSSDSLKRARGRRGLDILNQMRSELPLVVRSLDHKAEVLPNEEVDYKLVKLAKKTGGALVTNDFNLNKVAELQGVPVLNINELANALKPVVLPGEEMAVMVIKEGKEMTQGIGYLDDGTMIVIEGARRRIGETLDVVVSSVLQTVAGKMIFATIKQHDDGYEPDYTDGHTEQGQGQSQGTRPYSGGRPRRPFRER